MDYCDKCEEDIDKLEPCIKIEYGFSNSDGSFTGMGFIHVHVDCFTDADALSRILESFEKN